MSIKLETPKNQPSSCLKKRHTMFSPGRCILSVRIAEKKKNPAFQPTTSWFKIRRNGDTRGPFLNVYISPWWDKEKRVRRASWRIWKKSSTVNFCALVLNVQWCAQLDTISFWRLGQWISQKTSRCLSNWHFSSNYESLQTTWFPTSFWNVPWRSRSLCSLAAENPSSALPTNHTHQVQKVGILEVKGHHMISYKCYS